MATYLIVNLVFLGAAILALILVRKWRVSRAMLVAIVILMACTAVFDSLIILLGVCGYDITRMLGVRIGLAPIEDFFYALFAGIMVPMIWSHNKEDKDETKD